ncbi:MAG: response regulator transcription factor [Fulvivirga sp.]|uniref:response regulator transcription factor n=1 Tax=Fulvivirga sp. TaxID=1931237 RepID=UPI0032ECDE46
MNDTAVNLNKIIRARNNSELDKYKILLIDSDQEFNKLYNLLISSVTRYFLLDTYEDVGKAIRSIKRYKPDLIIIDPNPDNFASEIQKIRKIMPKVKIVINTNHIDGDFIQEVFSFDVSGFISKSSGPREFLNSIELILQGKYHIGDNVAQALIKSLNKDHNSPLTFREKEVLEQLASGMTYMSISKNLKISVATVKTHLNHVYWKLNAQNKSDALTIARQKKYI